jgi:hypothetical protein
MEELGGEKRVEGGEERVEWVERRSWGGREERGERR